MLCLSYGILLCVPSSQSAFTFVLILVCFFVSCNFGALYSSACWGMSFVSLLKLFVVSYGVFVEKNPRVVTREGPGDTTYDYIERSWDDRTWTILRNPPNKE